MNKKDLDILLSKYYRGETTLDEERLLRESLASDDADAMLMQALRQMENEIEVPDGLETELSGMIDQWQEEEQRAATAAWWKRPALWSLAASVILLMAVGWWLMRDRANVNDDKPIIAQKDKTMPQDSAGDVQHDLLATQVEQVSENQTVVPVRAKVKPVKAYKHHEVAQHASQLAHNISEDNLSPEDELLALEALEKFSTVLNKGASQISNAEEKIDNISNTIQQHLL